MASSGNFCTINPLVESDSTLMNGTLSNGNVKYVSSGDDGWVCNMAMTNKTYCEVRIDALSNYGGTIGFRSMTTPSQTYDAVTFQCNASSGVIYHYKGTSDQSYSGNIGGTVSAGSIVMMAFDPATYKWWVGVNGTWRNSGDPANGTGFVFEGSSTMFEDMSAFVWGGWKGGANGISLTYNFGQDSTFGGQETAGGNADGNGFGDFKYSVPTGFLANCSGNIVISDDIDPAQTDDDYPAKNFNTVLYTGDGSTSNAITGLGFQPDLVWIKQRSSPASTYSNALWDSTRGRAGVLISTRTDAERTNSTSTQDLVSFDSDGFTVGTNNNTGSNQSGKEVVAWCWKGAGGTTASNGNGSITSTVQANTKAGFSIATYTSPGSGTNHTVGHGLSGVDFVITKNRSATFNWYCFHKLSPDKTYRLNSGSEHSYANWSMGATTWGSENGYTHDGTSNFVAYAWQNVEGMQKFGSYTGNADADGPFVYTGFRPRLIFTLLTNSTSGWRVRDTARDTHNPSDTIVWWNRTDQEYDSSGYNFDILSNGFKVRNTGSDFNTSGSTYLYGAWGDVPFKYNNTF